MWIAILFVFIGVVSRVVPHIPNFSPLVAISLFAGVYVHKKHGYLIPLCMYVLSDLVLGLHHMVLFTWPSIILIYGFGLYARQKKSVPVVCGATIISSAIFYCITNFGVWLVSGMYPRTLSGLIDCYVLAIPFLRTSLLSDCVYVAVLFGGYEFVMQSRRSVQQTW